MKLTEGNLLEKHFLKFEETVRELKSVGAKLEEMDIICHLLLTLPKDYDAIVTALETLETEKLTLEFVKGKLLDQEIKRQNQQEGISGETSAVFLGNSKAATRNYQKSQYNQINSRTGKNFTTSSQGKPFSFNCHNCGKPGHKRSECRWQKQAHQTNLNKSETSQHITFLATALQSTSETEETTVRWYVDSGATDHMVNSEEYFSNLCELENPIQISVAKSNESLYATKVGNINIILKDNRHTYQTAEITNVLYVENLRHNLLSVYRLEKAGLKVIFKGDNVLIMENSNLLARSERDNNLYQIEFKILQKREANICKNSQNIQIWHKRLGHLGNKNLLSLSKYGIVNGLNFGKMDTNEVCGICIESKITKLPFQKKLECNTKRPLELIHSDICGPISPTTHDGKRYFLTFIDDYTHFTVVYLMKNKSEMFEYFKNFEATVTTKFETKISSLCCDNGSEYFSNVFQAFCRTKGIQIKNTIPYTPELNGVTERLNRTLVEKARAMLLESKLSKEMWGEAILCATYLLNRSPTSSLRDNVTPAEIFYGLKPDLKNLRIFGCLAYHHIPKQKQKGKFDSKGKACIIIGYTHNGYRLQNPISRKLVVARNVIFDESKNIEYFDNKTIDIKSTWIDNRVEQDEITEETNDKLGEASNGTQELVEEKKEEDECTDKYKQPEVNVKRSTRIKKLSEKYEDYVMVHLTLSAESFVNEVPKSLEVAKTRPDYKYWKSAIDKEIKALKRNNTWTPMEKPKNVKIIDSKWVFRLKRYPNGQIKEYKARLVAKDFMQRQGFDYEETYSPVARLITIRTLLAVINHKNLIAQQMDVKSVFLHGTIKEDIYMRKPEGFEGNDGLVYKLNKALYGLKQAPLSWNNRFNEFAKSQQLRRSENDPCLYVKLSDQKILYLLIYVDDIIQRAMIQRKLRV